MARGSIYSPKAQTRIHRHAFDIAFNIPGNEMLPIRLLAYSEVDQVERQVNGENVTGEYTNLVVPEGSVVRKYWLDLTIIPHSTTVTQDVYIGWVQLSWHDFEDASNSFLPLSKHDENKDIFTSTSADKSFSPAIYRSNPKNRHWLRGMKKITMYGGRPASQAGWLKVPPKCRRSEEGMYWALVICNASDSSINVKTSRAFNEFPLLD